MAPTLSVCLVTANSSDRLAWWCQHVRGYADELVIAVGADSLDDTAGIAHRYADQVLAIGGEPARARDWVHRRAIGDWILLLDDDEILASDAAGLLRPLLDDRDYTHYLLPTRQVVDCGADLGWVPGGGTGPDPTVRLWRNLGGLHFVGGAGPADPLVGGRGRHLPDDGPLAVYALADLWSGVSATTGVVAINLDAPRRLGPSVLRTQQPKVSELISIERLDAHNKALNPDTSPWSATYRLMRRPAEVTTNRGALVRVAIRNTSEARWPTSGRNAGRIVLGNRWSTPEFGDEVAMGDTTVLPHPVAPGEEVVVDAGLWTPRLPGRYRLTVELLRESDAWFSQHGVAPLGIEVLVEAGDAPLMHRHYVGRLPDDPDRNPGTAVPSVVVAHPPVRVLDTRDGSGLVDARLGPIPHDGMVVLRLCGAPPVPPGASGVLATVTVLGANYHGWLAAFATDGTKGEAFPILHFSADGRPVTTTVTTAVGVARGHGRVSFHLSAGPPGASGHFLVDVCGYLLPAP
ncbi:MAG: hypothetical protein M3063_16970 [Actinomycetota bacterium]|nr:hypothetical protein [Actinomycetota bacterium]